MRVSSLLAQPGKSPRPGWRRVALPQELGDCRADRLELDDGLTLVHSQYTPQRDLIEENAAGYGARTLVITLAMQGVSAYRGADGAGLDFRGGHTTVTALQRSRGERRYSGGATVSQLRLLVGEPVLRRYAGDDRAESLLGAGGLRCLSQGRTTPELASVAMELASGVDPLDAHIRALTLLSRRYRPLGSRAGVDAGTDGPGPDRAVPVRGYGLELIQVEGGVPQALRDQSAPAADGIADAPGVGTVGNRLPGGAGRVSRGLPASRQFQRCVHALPWPRAKIRVRQAPPLTAGQAYCMARAARRRDTLSQTATSTRISVVRPPTIRLSVTYDTGASAASNTSPTPCDSGKRAYTTVL
ncbi:hypothetical protein G6F65_016321 [Rhizopus arrhizus]|nr:hypothetical protein G6F65_016321 [Rhizopus arrhizus]